GMSSATDAGLTPPAMIDSSPHRGSSAAHASPRSSLVATARENSPALPVIEPLNLIDLLAIQITLAWIAEVLVVPVAASAVVTGTMNSLQLSQSKVWSVKLDAVYLSV